MEKIISFIIPAYNAEIYLRKALDSLIRTDCLGQTEIIVVNDGSTDHTEGIAKSYVAKYPDVVFLITKMNGGHGSAINMGTCAAKGKYLKIIDADDWIVKDNLLKFIQVLTRCDADVVLTPFHHVDMNSGDKSAWRMYCQEYERFYTMTEVVNNWKSFDRCLTFHGITYKTKFYNNYRYELPEGIFYEDHEFASIPCCRATKIYPVDLFLYQYMVGNAQQSVSDDNRVKRISHVEQVTHDLLEYEKIYTGELSDSGREYLFKKTEAVVLSHYVVTCLIQRDKVKGRENAVRFNKMIQAIAPQMLERVKKKYKVYLLLNRLNISQEQYWRILHSKLYSAIRRTHRIEKE